jgi:hypothetical protein
MPSTNYDLSAINSVVYNGTSLSEIILDGTSIWTPRNSVTVTIAADTNNYTLTPAAVAGYSAGITDVSFVVNSGVVIGSSTTATAALTVSGFASGDVVTINNSGYIVGAGGRGGNSNTNNATVGGTAITTTSPIEINNLGTISGGGGGGGARDHTTTTTSSTQYVPCTGKYCSGGSITTSYTYTYYSGSPGGGGAGRIVGQPGTVTAHGNSTPAAGSAGSLTTGGAGGSTKAAGAGGALGQNGVSGTWAGGLAGHYIIGSGFATWISVGTRAGRTAT